MLTATCMSHYGRQARTAHGGEAEWSAYETHFIFNAGIILSGLVILLIDLQREQVTELTL